MLNINQLSLLSMFIVLCFNAIEIKANLCKLPLTIGDCKGSIDKFYFDHLNKKCESFVYSGCGGNDNNFQTMQECKETCVYPFSSKILRDTSSIKTSNESDFDFIYSENDEQAIVSIANGISFGNWTHVRMNSIDIEQNQITTKAVTVESSNKTDISSTTKKPSSDITPQTSSTSKSSPITLSTSKTTTISPLNNNTIYKVISPVYEKTNPKADGILSHKITFQSNRISFQRLEIRFKILGYKVLDIEADSNPYLGLFLTKSNNTDIKLFDINDYGKVFENDKWQKIGLNFNQVKLLNGDYNLKLIARKGSEKNSTNVFIDYIKIEKHQRLNINIAKNKFTTTTTITTLTPIITSTISTSIITSTLSTMTTTIPESTTQNGSLAGIVVLTCLTIILAIALMIISYKYWHLKREMGGTYSVTATLNRDQSRGNAPMYENPAYGAGGDHDRYVRS